MLLYSNRKSITGLIARLDRLEQAPFKSREEEVKARISRFIDQKVEEWDRLHGDPSPEDDEELIKISNEIEEYKRAAWEEYFRTTN